MIDDTKILLLKRLALGIVTLALACLVFTAGLFLGGHRQTQSQDKEGLTPRLVEQFLISYYTKDKLSSNRKAYRPYMVDTLYQKEIEKEESPQQKLYKDYVTDYRFEKADIYLGQDGKTALVKVTYSTKLWKTPKQADTTETISQDTKLKLTYTKERSGKYLITEMTPLILQEEREGQHFDDAAVGG